MSDVALDYTRCSGGHMRGGQGSRCHVARMVRRIVWPQACLRLS